MRLLYCAIDQRVPGTTGGSVHVAAVADGLAALGHEVHVLATPGDSGFPSGPAAWHAVSPPGQLRQLRLLRSRRVRGLADAIGPDVVIERYYNFGGEGLRAAARIGALAALEINAPVVDYPGSPKRALDRLLLVEPMRRWREWQCRTAALLITPSAAILPAGIPRDRILEIEWGADIDRFHPGVMGKVPFPRARSETLAVFAGAFRAWHGAVHLVRAIRRLREQGRRDVHAVLIGSGPELESVKSEAAGLDGVTFTGELPHAAMPACLAAADVGVAPFELAAHPPLALGFYWSPLKIFEYMSAGLPVVAPAVDRLPSLIEHDREGLLYDQGDPSALAFALARLASDPAGRRALGAAARERAVREYSWAAHCRRLEAAFAEALARRRTARH